ncbi:hypothetical protein M3Y99_00178700 [Aphelenchoides fujianensis]|nr:hypothetical protein M3Y99_00178700 [Aphelenchoides fujianensis]
MIDCHCHLADEAFDSDLGDVIQRAKEAGVEAAIVVAEFADQFDRVLNLAVEYPDFCFPALGLHPVQRGNRSAADRLAAVGEVGLDFTPRYVPNGDEDKREQREVFRRQIELANELQIPVNVHSRSAGRPVVEWLLKYEAKAALLHAFSGNVKSAKPAIERGFFFSIPPSFASNPEREKLVQAVPLEQLCLETDSPVLGPDRNERNEPKNLRVSAEFIARVKNVDVEEVIRVTSRNARRLFRFVR